MRYGRLVMPALCAALLPALIGGCREPALSAEQAGGQTGALARADAACGSAREGEPARQEPRPPPVVPRGSAAPPASTPTAPELSPAEVVARLQTLHRQRDYEKIAELIVADRRTASLELLQAVDAVLDANTALRQTAERRYHSPLIETRSLAALVDNIGPFSNRVRRISQQFKGDAAIVTLQAGDNLPLIHAAFEHTAGRWQYRPEPSPARLTVELRELARLLRDVERAVDGGAPFESYLDAFYYRVLPQMVKVVTARDDLAEGAPEAGSEPGQ